MPEHSPRVLLACRSAVYRYYGYGTGIHGEFIIGSKSALFPCTVLKKDRLAVAEFLLRHISRRGDKTAAPDCAVIDIHIPYIAVFIEILSRYPGGLGNDAVFPEFVEKRYIREVTAEPP